MKSQLIIISILFLSASSTGLAQSPKPPQPGVALTIYNENFAVVKDSRQMDFEKGINKIKFTDVASAIDPTSVNFQCISAPGAISILEQNYEYDLVNTDSLLNRYIDKNVSVTVKGSGADTGKQSSGILAAAKDNNLILRQNDGIKIISRDDIEEISLEQIPEDLVTKPTLMWLANANQKGSQLCQVAYTTERIGWKADYSAILSADETKIDFTGWVTINNKCGATYKNSTIKLIAGDVRRIVEPRPMLREKRLGYTMDAAAAGFKEKPFMEYHLYTLGRKSTINNNQIKQIEFITPALGVSAKKLYIYERSKKRDKVQIKLEFANTTANNLGIALPKGKIRVFKKDPADGMLEFVGEDKIDHTAVKEKLSLYIGDAFDVVPEYTPVKSERSRRMHRQKHKIELRNRKRKAIIVFVDEKFPAHVNWTIDESTHKYKKRDAHTARFEVKLKPDSTDTIEYTATQNW